MAKDKQTPIKGLTIYYYHDRPTQEAYDEWKRLRFPGHLMYGQPLLEKYGIKSVMHRFKYHSNRLKLIFYVTKEILTCKKKYDVLYGTSFRGIELIIFLRAMGLYRKPVVIWHHTAVTNARSRFRETVSKFFYRGIDQMFFFSQKLIDDSINSGKVKTDRLHLIHWGPDLTFYDHVMAETEETERKGFISTGKENRDLHTLLKAFMKTDAELDVYTSENCGSLSYKRIVDQFTLPSSIKIHYTTGIIPYELARIVATKECIVICCLEFAYTVGLTTLVEALALGMPVICSRNPNFGFDIDQEGIGITVDYNDAEGWEKAVDYVITHPEEAKRMGERARQLAEKQYNMEIFAKEIAEVIKAAVQR